MSVDIVLEVGTLVLIHRDHKPALFARVESILPDTNPKMKEWWSVTFLPLDHSVEKGVRLFTWMLDDSHIRGADYTMGGVPMRLEILPPAGFLLQLQEEMEKPAAVPAPPAKRTTNKGSGSNVIKLFG